MKGIPQHVFSHCFSLPSFRSSLLGLEPGQNPWCLVLRPNEAQASDGSLQKKFSERHSDRWEVGLFGFREKYSSQDVGHQRGWVWWPRNVVWLVFPSWVISYANEWEDHPNNWGTTDFLVFRQCLGTVLAPLGVSFSLQIEDQDLVEFDLSSWTHLILISLCNALGPCHSFKSCALRPSLLLHAVFLSPQCCLGSQCCLYNLLNGQTEDS